MIDKASSATRSQHQATWRKSSFCQAGECVEIVRQNDVILLRNSTHPENIVRYTPEEWRVFAAAVRAGEFSDLD